MTPMIVAHVLGTGTRHKTAMHARRIGKEWIAKHVLAIGMKPKTVRSASTIGKTMKMIVVRVREIGTQHKTAMRVRPTGRGWIARSALTIGMQL